MKSSPTIVVIGAGSLTFTPKVLRDVINHPDLGALTLRLMDIDAERLAVMDRLARRLFERAGRPAVVQATTDRKEALRGADYVVVSVEVDRYALWKQDFQTPVRLGVRQVMGELGGPGGLFHSLRQIPVHVDIAREAAAVCPRAMLLVESNPLNRVCLAMRRYSACGQIIGLCHGVEIVQARFAELLGYECDDLEATAAGTNHFTWILDLRLKATGEDLYPAIKDKLASQPPDFEPLSRKLLDVYGYYPSPGDDHIGEYLPYAWEFCGLEGPPLDEWQRDAPQQWAYFDQLGRGADTALPAGRPREQQELRLREFFSPRSWVDTLAFPIIDSIEAARLRRMPAVNMLSGGAIGNLPRDVFVEAPAVVDGSGIRLIHIGDLPAPLAASCRRDIEQMELTVEAAVRGDRRLALQAMLLDPVIDSVCTAERVLDEMLKQQAEYLPQFA